MLGVHSVVYFILPGANWMPYSPMGAQPLGFAPLQPFGVYPWQAYVQPGDGHQSTPGMYRVTAPSTTLSGGSLLLLSCSLTIPSIWVHIAFGAQQNHLIPLPSLHDGKESSFQGLVPSDDTVDSESVMGIKPCDSSVVIGIRLMSLLAPGLQSSLLPNPTFILGSLVRCHH